MAGCPTRWFGPAKEHGHRYSARVSQRVCGAGRRGRAPVIDQQPNTASDPQSDRRRHPSPALPGARTTRHLSRTEARRWLSARGTEVVLHSVRVRELPQVLDSSTLALLPAHGRGVSGSRSMLESATIGARKQGENPEHHERLVLSCDPMGMGREESDHKRASEFQAHKNPDVLTPEEITALLSKLPEPLRMAAELDAFTGLRRGELIGLQWRDVDLENLVIHVRRSVVMMVEGAPKTEASAKDVPLDSSVAESLKKLRDSSAYNQPSD